jgi:hypothetical protein
MTLLSGALVTSIDRCSYRRDDGGAVEGDAASRDKSTILATRPTSVM